MIFDSFRHKVLDDLGGYSSGGGNGAYNLTATAVHGKDNPDPSLFSQAISKTWEHQRMLLFKSDDCPFAGSYESSRMSSGVRDDSSS